MPESLPPPRSVPVEYRWVPPDWDCGARYYTVGPSELDFAKKAIAGYSAWFAEKAWGAPAPAVPTGFVDAYYAEWTRARIPPLQVPPWRHERTPGARIVAVELQ